MIQSIICWHVKLIVWVTFFYWRIFPEDIVLFTAPPSDTPLVNLDKTLVDYNMWFLEKSYVAELTVYNKTDNYNKELYEMYLEAAEKTV